MLGAAGGYSVIPDLRGFCCNLVVPVSAQLQTKDTFACLAARVVFFSEERVEGKVPETLPEPVFSRVQACCMSSFGSPETGRGWGITDPQA